MLSIIVSIVLASGQSFDDPKPYSPNDTILFALSDVQTLDPAIAKYCRYLSMANSPPAERLEHIKTINFVCNSLSRRQSMVYVTPVPGSNNSVVRLMLNEYRISTTGWDTVAIKGSGPVRVSTGVDQPDPYYTVNLTDITGTKQVHRRDKDGDLLYWDGDKSRPVYDTVSAPRSGLSPGTWFDLIPFKALCAATGTEYPILRLDWFNAQVSLAPAYNEYLGLKTLGDFAKLVRFRTEDQDLSGRAVVADSQLVSLHQRGIEFTPKVNGTYWQTYDYKKGAGLNDLLKDPLLRKRDAGEAFAELPNGLQAFTLVDQNDKIIDVADGNIVADQVTPWKNKLVWNGLYSCTNCHKNGAQDIQDEVRPLTTPPRGLISKKAKQFEEFVDLYGKVIEPEIAQTRARYAAAVSAATRGRTPEQNTAAYGKLFVDFQQKPLTMATAAAEVGCTPAQLANILARIVEPDPAVTTLLAGRPLRRDLWESAFPLIATAVWKDIKK